jgi:RHS repeat-associated protein
MGVTSYYSFGGEILGEATGGVRRDYLTDALGSVTGTVTGAGVIENTYRYKPYGETLAKTGAAIDPKFLWVGTWGYGHLTNNHSNIYVRARHFSTVLGRWTTKDPVKIPVQESNLYLYVSNYPTSSTDPTGLFDKRGTVCSAGVANYSNKSIRVVFDYCVGCKRGLGFPCSTLVDGTRVEYYFDLPPGYATNPDTIDADWIRIERNSKDICCQPYWCHLTPRNENFGCQGKQCAQCCRGCDNCHLATKPWPEGFGIHGEPRFVSLQEAVRRKWVRFSGHISCFCD